MSHIAAALGLGALASSFLFGFVDADVRGEGEKTAFDVGKLRLQFFFRRVDDDLSALAKNKLLSLEKAPEIALVDLADIDFVDLPLIEENDLVDRILCHDA